MILFTMIYYHFVKTEHTHKKRIQKFFLWSCKSVANKTINTSACSELKTMGKKGLDMQRLPHNCQFKIEWTINKKRSVCRILTSAYNQNIVFSRQNPTNTSPCFLLKLYHAQSLVLRSFHHFTLSGSFVINATKMKYAMYNHTMQLFFVCSLLFFRI